MIFSFVVWSSSYVFCCSEQEHCLVFGREMKLSDYLISSFPMVSSFLCHCRDDEILSNSLQLI